ncbi:MAG: hypothetical protein KAT62_00140 [Desulfuromonadales bacterium]|nr:hypothetical protein [Desulfuromonadales bacterium]
MEDKLIYEELVAYDEDSNLPKLAKGKGDGGMKKLLADYTDSKIRQISGVSRSALVNYIKRESRISKRGQEAIKKLVAHYNNEPLTEDSLLLLQKHDLSQVPDRELMLELKRRGYNLTVTV